MKKIMALVLFFVLIIGIFSGCSSGGGTPSAAPSGTAATKKENVVTIARQTDTASLNMYVATDGPSLIYGKMMYDSLIRLDDKGNLTPGLATSWQASADGKQVTLKLRNDVKFQNGDPFTSADVKYTYERYVNDKNARSVYDWTALVSVDTPDAQTAIFNFKQPYPSFLTALPYSYVYDKKALDAQGDKYWDHPIGTGPWKFVSWTPGQQIVFQRNDDYWDWGSNKSNVDKVIIKPVGEDATRLAAIQSGDADIAEPITSDQAKQIQNDKNIKVEDVLNSAQVYFCFSGKGVFADKNVRQAWTMAIDRTSIVNNIVNGGKPAVWTVDSSCMGYKDVPPTFDAAKAKQLLASSSYKGQPIKIYAVTGQVPRINEVLQAVSSMLNAVGFNTTVSFEELAALNAQRAAGNYDVYFVSIRETGGDASALVQQRWLNDIYKSGFVNDQLNALIKAQSSEMDAAKRAAIFQQIFQIAYDDAGPFVPLYQLDTVQAYKTNISGARFTVDGMNDYSRVMKK